MDPSDDCTFWYVGDYYKAGATNYSTRIGGFRMPGCVERAAACTVKNRGGAAVSYWTSSRGKAILARHAVGRDTTIDELAAARFNLAYGTQDGNVIVEDPVVGDRPTVRTLIDRAAAATDPAQYAPILHRLNANAAMVCK
jgi:hypothetical protein